MAINWRDIRNPELRNLLKNEVLGKSEVADGTIPAYRLIEVDSSGDHVVGTVDSETIVGANGENQSKSANDLIQLEINRATLVGAAPILAGKRIKCADNGRACLLVTDGVSGTTIKAVAAGGNFGNQPADDGVEVLSSEAADVDTEVTIIGTTHGGQTVVTETVALDSSDGTTPVSTTKTDWGVILAVKLASAITGTLTVREASGDQAITTIAAGSTSAGVTAVAAASQGAHNVKPTVVAGGASTKYVGIQYTATDGSTVAYQADQLNGTNVQTMTTEALLVTEIYNGDVATATAITVAVGAEEDENHACGRALSAQATVGSTFEAKLF